MWSQFSIALLICIILSSCSDTPSQHNFFGQFGIDLYVLFVCILMPQEINALLRT